MTQCLKSQVAAATIAKLVHCSFVMRNRFSSSMFPGRFLGLDSANRNQLTGLNPWLIGMKVGAEVNPALCSETAQQSCFGQLVASTKTPTVGRRAAKYARRKGGARPKWGLAPSKGFPRRRRSHACVCAERKKGA